jgi:hypothetical protein
MSGLATESAPHAAPKKGLAAGLPDRVAQLYYSHGLFIASHPFAIVIFAVSIILACWLVKSTPIINPHLRLKSLIFAVTL